MASTASTTRSSNARGVAVNNLPYPSRDPFEKTAGEVRKSGLLDTANDRIATLTERLTKSNADLEREFDRVLGPLPSTDEASSDQPSDPGSANDLHYRLSVLERVTDLFMITSTRARQL
jgi:hypothetical protein